MGKLLDGIQGPQDLRGLTVDQLSQVAHEVRELILEAVSEKGGHLASNLGAADLAVALHYTFDFQVDRLIWDVGHQCYPHKVLTGRKDRIKTVRQQGGLAGFPDPKESPYDPFLTSHAGTSVSTGLGLSAGNSLMRRRGKIVCVIGDGAMTSGVSMEALNNAGALQRDLLIILNHNQMSISPNVGALSHYLDRVRTGQFYREMKKELGHLAALVPSFGKDLEMTVSRMKDAVRHGLLPAGTIFEEYGLKYFGPVDGHHMKDLLETLGRLKNMEGPILLHLVTKKGYGFDYTARDPVTYHSPTAFDREKGEIHKKSGERPTYSKVFTDAMIELADRDPRIVAVTAAMAEGTGLVEFGKKFPDRFFDVGIAEQHAVAFSAGLAASGLRPVAAIYSTFLQRAYDQVFHEVCLQNLPVVFALDRAGITGGDGATAQGNFDIAYLRTLPQIALLAPRNATELKLMLRFAFEHGEPVAIRFPRDTIPVENPDDVPAPIELGRAEVVQEGRDVVLWALGCMVEEARSASRLLQAEGISCAIINARFVKPLDRRLLAEWLERTPLLVALEDHALHGGFGSAVLEAASDLGLDAGRIRRVGIPDRFIEHGGRKGLVKMLGLDAEGLARAVRQFLRSGSAVRRM
ncbi:MAG: 1-deoxy-D-xylulose-5-phosphate synthase [Planctomycetes bacterium]|nr:1-deoxy-D-xylulose-5-phosphate synthase [Planctomycetota bacterium]